MCTCFQDGTRIIENILQGSTHTVQSAPSNGQGKPARAPVDELQVPDYKDAQIFTSIVIWHDVILEYKGDHRIS